MTILLAGGYGKTSLEVAKILTAQNVPFVVGSRRGQAGVPRNIKGVKFDWEDSSTFAVPFDEEPSIDRVYMTIATTAIEDLLPTVVVPFVELAKKRGVKRFVFLSASLVEKGAWIHGKVHQYLADSGLDYAILRPTWFYENFTADYRGDIRDGQITTATKQGKLPFISTKDIAEVAVSALTDEKSHNTDHIIFGPELLSYDDVCAKFTKILGNKVTHAQVSYDDLKEMYSSLPPLFSSWMVDLDRGIAEGREEKLFHADIPGKVIGKVYLDDFIRENREVWLKK